jgi:DNA-binding MarR family transcriptional regulator
MLRTEPPLAALLRAAQSTYRAAVAARLREAGFGDLPRNGAVAIAVAGPTGAPLSEVIRVLGLSKQATGALVDTLVARGYLDRVIDPDDRRRLMLMPTIRGRAATEAIMRGLQDVDAQLLARISPEQLEHTRATLEVLAGIAPQAGADE